MICAFAPLVRSVIATNPCRAAEALYERAHVHSEPHATGVVGQPVARLRTGSIRVHQAMQECNPNLDRST